MCTATKTAPELDHGRNVTPEDRLTRSVEESAKALGISRSSAWKAVNDGTLRTVRVGHRVLVPVKAIEALLAGSEA